MCSFEARILFGFNGFPAGSQIRSVDLDCGGARLDERQKVRYISCRSYHHTNIMTNDTHSRNPRLSSPHFHPSATRRRDTSRRTSLITLTTTTQQELDRTILITQHLHPIKLDSQHSPSPLIEISAGHGLATGTARPDADRAPSTVPVVASVVELASTSSQSIALWRDIILVVTRAK